MTTTVSVLALVSASELRDEVERITAAVGARVVHVDPDTPLTRKAWATAGAVVLDGHAARRESMKGLPRRSDVFLVAYDMSGGARPDAEILSAAIAIGAREVFSLPGQAGDFVRVLSGVSERTDYGSGRGPVAAVIGGRGGAGASLFAAAMALSSAGSLLIDLDAWGGGIDLLVGAENVSGLRWPDIAVRDGRLSWPAVRDALPRHRGIFLLSGSRGGHVIAAGAVEAVVEAGRLGGATVVCDLPRQLSEATRCALDIADLLVVVASCDVRSCAATAAAVPALTAINPNAGLVVRGPSPGGLRPGEFAGLVKLPLLAAMRAEPVLAEKLEHGGLRLRVRSPLGVAARQVLAVLGSRPVMTPERAA